MLSKTQGNVSYLSCWCCCLVMLLSRVTDEQLPVRVVVVTAWTTTTRTSAKHAPSSYHESFTTLTDSFHHHNSRSALLLLFNDAIKNKVVVEEEVDEEKSELINEPAITVSDSVISNRRHFMNGAFTFGTTTALVASGVFTQTTTGNYLEIVNAATTTATSTSGTSSKAIDYKYYTPAKDSLSSKVIVITGGTTGLGLESAKRLAYGGATVIVTSRTQSKGDNAVRAIQEYLNEREVVNPNVYSVLLDLDDLENVRTFPSRFQKLFASENNINNNGGGGGASSNIPKIDVLLNNAGVMAIPTREVTKDGYERTFQSNHLGHFLLTNKLMPFLQKNARVVNVSSQAYKFASSKGLEIDNLNGEIEYGPWSSYGQSKLANILFSMELQKRAKDAGLSFTSVSLHPGAVQTDLGRNLIGPDRWEEMKQGNYKMSFTDQLLFNALQKIIISVEEGASTQIYVASVNDATGNANDPTTTTTTTTRAANGLVGGGYYEQCKLVPLQKFAMDTNKSKALWEMSETMTGEPFNL